MLSDGACPKVGRVVLQIRQYESVFIVTKGNETFHRAHGTDPLVGGVVFLFGHAMARGTRIAISLATKGPEHVLVKVKVLGIRPKRNRNGLPLLFGIGVDLGITKLCRGNGTKIGRASCRERVKRSRRVGM